MVLYRCEQDNLEQLHTSICPHCHGRAYAYVCDLYWCKTCQVPTYTKECERCGGQGERVASDMRPVFPEEKFVLEAILLQQRKKKEAVNLEKVSVWNSTGNHYYGDGKRIPVTIGKLKTMDLKQIQAYYEDKMEQCFETYDGYFREMQQRFVEANKGRFAQLDQDAISYIKNVGEKYDKRDMLVSFSGGKDSTVVSDLVDRALGTATEKIVHIFGDTTLEFPTTYEYVKRYKKQHYKTPVIPARNRDKDFYELCKLVGPPSRVMRWCCTVFKTGAITRQIEKMFRNKSHIVTFYGIRRSESASRSKYEKESDSPKISKQTVVSPIIDWYDFDVWLYLFTRGIDFNEAYRWGYTRVGCWCCPNNSDWSEFLSQLHMRENYTSFHHLLVDFATEIGKPDPEEYVSSGNWKARQGGNGVAMAQKSVISFTPCATQENAFNYSLQKPITEEFYELFKPFGYLNYELGNKRLGEVFVLNKKGEILLGLQGRIGSKQLKVTIYQTNFCGARNLKAAEERVKCQLTKYQMCMGCLACEGVCKRDAITIREKENQVHYTISDEKCVRCGHCVNHFVAGCYMRKVLAIKR